MVSMSDLTLGLLVLLTYSDWTQGDVLIINPDNQTEKVFIDYELTFTAAVPTGGIQGLIAVADPANACEEIKKPPFPTNSSLKWFVLIERYPCSFEQKVRNAQLAGFQAAIVYNVGTAPHQQTSTPSYSGAPTTPFHYRDKRSPTDVDIEIPGILIGQDDGKKIKTDYTFRTGYTVVINPDSSFNLNTYLLPFAIVIGFCFVSMLLFMVIKCIKDRRRSRRNRLSSRHLKHLPTTKFKKGDRYEVCAVCLDDYCEGEKLRILPCEHAYHTKCIDPWLTNNRRNCPICKRKVAIPGVTPDSDSDSDMEQDASETRPLLQSSSGSQNASHPRTNGGTFTQSVSSRSSSVSSASVHGSSPRGPQYRHLESESLPGPSSQSSSFQEATQAEMHSPPVSLPGHTRSDSSDSSQEDIYHSSTTLLPPNNRHSINGGEDDDEGTPPILVVVKTKKKSRSDLVI